MKVGKLIKDFVKGIVTNRKQTVYNLKFVKDMATWYIDIPWEGDRRNLAMVAGADTLLDELNASKFNNSNKVSLTVEKVSNNNSNDDEIILTRTHCGYGADYAVASKYNTKKLWLCPVTLFVLGEYPKFMKITV